ncbi:MAG: serine protease [Deltaproteobacteria bacterium]|nr:serine protease [Deltaproteobacteria bacterium]
MGFFLGLCLAGLGFWLLHHFFYVRTLYRAQVQSINAEGLQSDSLDLLKSDRDFYQKAQSGDVCPWPRPTDEAPFFLLGEPKATAGADNKPVAVRQEEALAKVNQNLLLVRVKTSTPKKTSAPSQGQTSKDAAQPPQGQGQPAKSEGNEPPRENLTLQGAGFYCEGGFIVTSRSLVESLAPNETLEVFRPGVKTPFKATVLTVSQPESLSDYALLSLTDDSNPPLGLTITSEINPEGRVMALGFADFKPKADLDPKPINALGRVSSLESDRDIPIIGLTAEVDLGYLGGPLINQKSQVVGFLARVVLDQKGREIRVALGARDLRAFLEATKTP